MFGLAHQRRRPGARPQAARRGSRRGACGGRGPGIEAARLAHSLEVPRKLLVVELQPSCLQLCCSSCQDVRVQRVWRWSLSGALWPLRRVALRSRALHAFKSRPSPLLMQEAL